MSILRLVCEPTTGNKHYFTLDMIWDEEAGTVSGVGSEVIHEWIKAGSVPAHPHGHTHKLSNNPLRSRTDMAAMIGFQHRVPDALFNDYPSFGDDDDDGDPLVTITDMDGNVIGVMERVF